MIIKTAPGVKFCLLYTPNKRTTLSLTIIYEGLMNYAIGVVCALISAITFGVIPLFSVSLMKQGLHFNNVVFYRYIFAAAVIALVMRLMKKPLKITHQELPLLGILAFLNVGCSFFLMWGYNFLDSGLATSLYFLYPVFVTVAMMTFFGEKKSFWVGISIFLAVFGVSLLSNGGGGVKSGTAGIVIVLISALFYASYIVATNKTNANEMEPLKFTFYALFFGALYSLAYAIGTQNFQLFSINPHDLLSLAGLILFSTVISNLALIAAIQRIGSTMTAIFGALQPLTAVFVGIMVFNEPFTDQIVYSTACIIASVLIVLVSKHLTNPLTWNWHRLFEQSVQMARRMFERSVGFARGTLSLMQKIGIKFQTVLPNIKKIAIRIVFFAKASLRQIKLFVLKFSVFVQKYMLIAKRRGLILCYHIRKNAIKRPKKNQK